MPDADPIDDAPPDDGPAYDYEATDLGLDDDARAGALRHVLRDAMLTRFRATPKPWAKMSEDEQRDLASAFDLAAGEMVRAAMAVMLDFDAPHAVVRLGKIGFDSGEKAKIEGKFTADYDRETLVSLFEGQGNLVSIVMVQADDFQSIPRAFRPMPDQPALPLDEPPAGVGEQVPRSREEVEADVAAMGAREAAPTGRASVDVAPDGEPLFTEDEIAAAMKRAARMARGEKIVSASYLGGRLRLPDGLAAIVFARLVETGQVPAPPEAGGETREEALADIADQAAGFERNLEELGFESSEQELAAQTTRRALQEREAARA